jgi:NADH-quinone oxidoreductase subunit E
LAKNISENLDQIFSQFKGTRDELLPVMEAAQEEFGYLSNEVLLRIADFLKVNESQVYGVATFYPLFRLTPHGNKMVHVCRGTACHVRGGAHILKEVEKQLGIKPGETTEDNQYSLDTISCFGSCTLAPIVVINKTLYGYLKPSGVKSILNDSCACKESD